MIFRAISLTQAIANGTWKMANRSVNAWPHRLEVRTPGFHPGNRGSIPLGVTKYQDYIPSAYIILMIKHPTLGIEFNLMGYVVPGSYKDTDPSYAYLVTKVLDIASNEGFWLAVPEIKGLDDKPLFDRMDELGYGDRRVALMYDHEVPAVLGMCRIALANLLDKNLDPDAYEESYRHLPSPATMKILIGSLEEYERLRRDD